MKKHIGILIEFENGRIKPANMGMITLARSENTQLYAFVIHEYDSKIKRCLETFGVNIIIFAPLSLNDRHNPMTLSYVVTSLMDTHGIHTVFGLSSAHGKEILPRVAAALDAPLIMDCVDVDMDTWTAKTSQYSGQTMGWYKVNGTNKIFGIRPNIIEGRKSPVSAKVYDAKTSLPQTDGLKIINIGEPAEDGKIPVANADIILAGGRGIKNADNFCILHECAKKLNAAVGSSRVPVDFGWVPYSMQVGQTGEKVNPQVYLACGISGSVQHFAGMQTSGMVIAVNTDKDAAIISNSDYFAIGDAVEIISELNKILDQE